MSYFESLLLGTLAVAAIINFGHWRAWLWLAAGAASYLASAGWADAGLPLHPFVTALCDAMVCGAIYFVGRNFGARRWELPLFTVFQFSVLVSFVQLFRGPADYTYALLLELVNWCALAIIIGAGTMRLADAVMGNLGGDPDRGGHLRLALRAPLAPTRFDPWWWARWA